MQLFQYKVSLDDYLRFHKNGYITYAKYVKRVFIWVSEKLSYVRWLRYAFRAKSCI